MRAMGLAAVFILHSGLSAFAQGSEEYARKAQKSQTALECMFLLARLDGDHKEERARVFAVGFDLGREVIRAYRAGKIEKKDFESVVPKGYGEALREIESMNEPDSQLVEAGVLGRFLRAASDAASAEAPILSPDLQSRAAQAISKRNCGGL